MGKLEDLQKENEFLRDLIKNLPGDLQFQSKHYELELTKKQNLITMKTLPSEIEKDYSFSWLTYDEVSFEKMEAFLAPIIDYIPHHITFINSKGEITLINKQAVNDLEVHQQKIVGRHIRELIKIPDDQIAMLQTLNSGKPIRNKEILDRNYGILNTDIIRDSDGEILRIIGTFQFLNAIKTAEKQALAGRIAAGIAHEVRNPLTTVRGYLQHITSEMQPEYQKLFQSLLIPEIDRANKIITDFLTIAKPIQALKESFTLEALLEDKIGRFLRTESLLHDVTLSVSIENQVREEIVKVNAEELLQVFINLYQNALYAKKENVQLTISIHANLSQQGVCISFIDNGVGILPSMIPHIFDPFFTTKDDGTGLGLSLSRKLIENHGGTMEVKSCKSGTTFIIELPFGDHCN